jgi:hypothetical protein
MRILFLLCCLLSCSTLQSVGQEVLFAPFEKYDYQTGEYAVVGKVGGWVYCYQNSREGALLTAYDDSMHKQAIVMLDFFPIKIYSTKFYAYPDHINVLYQALEGNKVIQYAAQLDERGILKGKPIQIGVTKTSIFGAMRTYYYNAISENKQHIVVYSVTNKGKEIIYDIKWLDANMQLVGKSKATFKAEVDLDYGDLNVGNDGTVYVMAYSPTGAHDYADNLWLLSLPAGATAFESVALPINDKYATSGYTKVDNANGKVYFGGFYADNRNGDKAGVIFSAYDMSSKAYQTVKLMPFDQQMMQLTGARSKSSFNDFEVKQVIPKTDGGFVLVSEAIYISTRANYTPGFGYYSSFYSPYNTTMVKEYHFEDILAISYNKEGAYDWGAIIPKNQYSQDDGGIFASYSLLNSGGSLAFLFNDFNTSHSRIQLATIDPNGKVISNTFSVQGNDDKDWLPSAGKQVASRTLIIPCLRKKQICFAKVVF